MSTLFSQFDKNDKSVHALTSRNEVLNKEIDQQRTKIETLRAALENASESFGENDKRTQNWQIQLNKAQAELNGMERELAQNTDLLDDFSHGTDNSADSMEDATDAADDLASNVDEVGSEMDDAGKKTSVFGDVLKANLLSEAIIGGVKDVGFGDDQEFCEFAERLGNKISLESNTSRSIGDAWFKTKKQRYQDSNYQIAKALAHYPKDTWTKEDIVSATDKAAKRIVDFIFE